MTRQEIIEIYEKRVEEFSDLLDITNHRYDRVATLRLLVFVFGIVASIYAFRHDYEIGAGVFTGAVIIFLILMKIHLRMERKKNHIAQLVSINQDELEASEFNMKDFDTGEEFLDLKHHFTYDLDIFGAGGLFQYINRATSIIGKKLLAQWLSNPEKHPNTIEKRQTAVQELARKFDWRQDFQAYGGGKSESLSDREQMLRWMKEESFYSKSFLYKALVLIMPLIFVSSTVLWLFGVVPYILPVGVFLINLLIVGGNLAQINHFHVKISKRYRMLSKYSSLFQSIEKERFESELMVELQESLIVDGLTSSKSIQKLAELIEYLDNRLNALAGILLNGIMLWDIHYISRIEKWRDRVGNRLEIWLDVIAQVDALISLGTFSYNHPSFIFPAIETEKFSLKSIQLDHPLIKSQVRVCNDFQIDKIGDLALITGANMAGKSTFIRTVGINLILGMIGAPVCAQSMKFSPINIYTSMRANDSLADNESYFFAELKRLQRMIQLLEDGTHLFVILDEILRGTNSKDKQTGSKGLIKRMVNLPAVGLIATHDLELGKLADEYPNQVTNLRFEVDIKGDHLDFDYKLKTGISQNLNATFLMKKMGIME